MERRLESSKGIVSASRTARTASQSQRSRRSSFRLPTLESLPILVVSFSFVRDHTNISWGSISQILAFQIPNKFHYTCSTNAGIDSAEREYRWGVLRWRGIWEWGCDEPQCQQPKKKQVRYSSHSREGVPKIVVLKWFWIRNSFTQEVMRNGRIISLQGKRYIVSSSIKRG